MDGISDYLTDNQLNLIGENSYVNGKHDSFSSGSVEYSWERTEKYIQKDLLKFESQLFANNQTIDTVRIILQNPRLEFIFESEDSSRFVTKVEFGNDIIFSFPDLQSNNLNNDVVTYHITERRQ